MADRGTVVPSAPAPPIVVTGYAPLTLVSGGTPVDPKRFLNVAGTAVPIQ
jgi:hypothetical protein